MGLHVHQVEVDEPAAGPPRPHADVQVLDAVGGEKEGTVWIHLRKPTPGAAVTCGGYHTSTTSILEYKLDPIAPKNLRASATTIESHPHEHTGTGGVSGRTRAARGAPAPPQPGDSLPSKASPGDTPAFVYGAATEFLCLLLFTLAITAKRSLRKLLVFRWSH